MLNTIAVSRQPRLSDGGSLAENIFSFIIPFTPDEILMRSLLGFPSLFFFSPLPRVRKLSKASDHFHKIQKCLLFSDVRAEHSESRLRQPRHGLLQPLNWIKEDTRIYIQFYSFKAVYALDKEVTGKEVEKQGMIRTLCRRGEETASVRWWRALPPELLRCPHCAFNAETSSSSANKPKLSHHWARKVTLACKEKL